MDVSVLVAWLQTLLPKVVLLFIVDILDLIGGVIWAIKAKNFSWEELPRFLQNLSQYLFAWIAAEVLSFAPKFLGVKVDGLAEALINYSGTAVYAFVILKYVASILGHIASIQQMKFISVGTGIMTNWNADEIEMRASLKNEGMSAAEPKG